jgi:hypothetical protein
MQIVTDILQIVKHAQQNALRSVNKAMLEAYWHIGRRIIEEEQHGSNRAVYGKAQMKNLSARLNKEFGKGFSVDNLENMRRFYTNYPSLTINADKLDATLSEKVISETPSRIFQIPYFQLSWSHYLLLMPRCSSCSEGSTGTSNKNRSPERLHFLAA